MTQELITMTQKELSRYEVIKRLIEKRLTKPKQQNSLAYQ